MAWFTRFTRFLDMHLVYGQERGMSCGPASVVMCVAKINKLSASQAVVPEARVRALYNHLSGGAHHFIDRGSGGIGLARALNHLQCGHWVSEDLTGPQLAARMISKVGVHSASSGPIFNVEPVILGVLWGTGGGHAVVVDTIRESGGQLYATICDPWDANVHVQAFSASGLTYSAHPERSVDGAGTSQHEWRNPVTGQIADIDIAHFGYDHRGITGTPATIIYRT